MSDVSRLSDVMGHIYDTALDPTLWIKTLGHSRDFVGDLPLRCTGKTRPHAALRFCTRSAGSSTNVSLPLFLPGVTISTTPTDFAAYNTFKMAKFDGKTWKFFGENIDTSVKQ